MFAKVLVDATFPVMSGLNEAIVPLPDETLTIKYVELATHFVHEAFVLMGIRKEDFDRALHRLPRSIETV